MAIWNEIKRSINSNLSKPLNELIGESSDNTTVMDKLDTLINNSGNNVGLVYIVDGNTCDYTDPDTQKTIQIQQLHLYYENDPRVTDEYGIKPEYQPLNSNTQITGITPDVERTMLRVIFHSFFEKVNSGAKYVFHHAEEHYVKIRENDAESPVDTVKVETDGVTINATTDWNIQEK